MQQNTQSQLGSGTPKGSKPEMSNMQELSQSILHSEQQISDFNKKRGFLNVNRLLHAPVFNPSANNSQVAQDRLSSTGIMGGMHNAQEQSSNTQVIWGTNINQNDTQMRMKNFINTFIVMTENESDYTKLPYYIEQLKIIMETEQYILEVDCDHIYQYDALLYKQLESYPSDIIPMFDLVVSQCYKEHCLVNVDNNQISSLADTQNILAKKQVERSQGSSGMGATDQNNEDLQAQRGDVIIQVRPFNMKKIFKIRELDPSHIDKLITLKGIVIRNSDVVPEMKEAHFKCHKCQHFVNVYLVMGKIQEPDICSNCKARQSFQMIHNFSLFSDKQHVKVQETPESVPEGETPQTMPLCAYEDLVDFVKPGDRVEIVGIYKAVGVRLNQHQRTLRNVYKTYIDVINYVKTDAKRYNVDSNDKQGECRTDEAQDNGMDIDEQDGGQEQALKDDHTTVFTEEQIKKFKDFSQDSLLYEKLIDAFAPSIWENQDVKKGILCQLFGGVGKEFSQSGRGRFRGEINILLCGDPSTAKSQLLQYVHKIAPRGIYTSGKGSSAVGLTVYVTKDPETRELVLESGALVLSDRGICCIDEFDKMDDNTRVILHEAMEQQTVSVAKAGIICTLNARTAILAAANPVHSKYDPKLSVVENIKLPPTLLSRFDLIYLILDKQNETSDRRLANHIVSLYSSPQTKENTKNYQQTQLIESNKMEREFFAQYISYARKYCRPIIPDYVVDDFVQEYTRMRSLGNSRKTITATPRQLESMIRIAESLAKMRLSSTIEKRDVEESVRLIKTAMQQSATDPTTGEIDMDIIATGVSSTSVERIRQLATIIKKIYSDHKERVKASGVHYHNLMDYVNSKAQDSVNVGNKKGTNVNEQEFRDALRQLEEENVISLFGHQKSPTIRFIQE